MIVPCVKCTFSVAIVNDFHEDDIIGVASRWQNGKTNECTLSYIQSNQVNRKITIQLSDN